MKIRAYSAAISTALLLALGACSKSPETAPPPAAAAAPSPAAAPAAPAASQAAAAGAPVGNPEASKDPVFNMPAKPVLDVSASKAQYDKIHADFMK